jgi:TolB-like protein/Tfp pilus assembly protein PilF
MRSGWTLIIAFCVLAIIAGGAGAWLVKASGWRPFGADTPGLARQTIAMLPIQGSGANPDPLFIEVQDALIDALGHISTLRAIARTSVMRYESSGKLMPEIGRELNADYIVETTASHDGDRHAMTARLVRAADDAQLWATRIERPLTQVLNMGGVALDIARVIGVPVSPEQRSALVAEYTPNSAAQAAYLEGQYRLWRDDGQSTKPDVLPLFERAVALDPQYARAWVSLARCYEDGRTYGGGHEAAVRAVAAARRAVEIDDRLTAAHLQLAWALFLFERDWKGTAREFRRALELNPSDFYVRFYFANFLASQGQLEEGKRQIAVAHELSPFAADAWGIDGLLHYYAREFDQAEVSYRRAIALAPRTGRFVGLGRTLTEKRDCTGNVQAFEQALRSVPSILIVRAELARAFAVCGRSTEARQILHDIETEPVTPGTRGATPQHRAYAYAALGDKDRAFELLMQAVADQQPDLQWVKVDPRLDPLRSDPRFRTYLRAVGFEE